MVWEAAHGNQWKQVLTEIKGSLEYCVQKMDYVFIYKQ